MNRLTFILYRLTSWLLVRKSGPPYYLTPLILFLLKHVLRYRKEMIARNMTRVFPEKSEKEIIVLRDKFYDHFADTFVEMLYGYTYPEKIMARLSFENMDSINNDIKNGRSVIVSGGHFYNWEWAGISLFGPCPHPIYGIYKKVSNPYFNSYLLEARASLGIKLIATRDAAQFIRDNEKNGSHAIYILAGDQSPTYTKKAIWTDFFGTRLPFFSGIQKFVDLYNMSVYYVHIERPSRGYYNMRASQIKAEPQQVTQAFAEMIERSIQTNPASWLWSHNRWKHEQLADQIN